PANFENIALSQAATHATGNALNNVLTGGSLNDMLDGGAGNDTLIGLQGDDTYSVDSSGDRVTEFAGGGNDTVYSSASFTLGANIETLILLGDAIGGTGNAQDNTLTGNGSDN